MPLDDDSGQSFNYSQRQLQLSAWTVAKNMLGVRWNHALFVFNNGITL